MPRYYFNVFDGCAMPDEEGTDLPGLQAAKIEALQVAQCLIPACKTEIGDEWRIEVMNDAGRLVFQMAFKALGAERHNAD